MSISEFKNARNLGDGDSSDDNDISDSDEGGEDTAVPLEEPEEEEAPAEEPTEEDWSWAQELKELRELHGVPLAEIAKAISEGYLPDALLNKLRVRLKAGDEEWEDTIEGARAGNMRYRDYTKKRQADAAERAQWMQEKEDIIGLHHGWKQDPSGRALLEGLQRMEYPVLEAAKLLAAEHAKMAEMTPQELEAYKRAQAAERQLEKFQFEQRQYQRQQQQLESKQNIDRNVEFVTQGAQRHFQSYGVPMNKGTWGVFLRHFDAIRSASPGTAWNEEMIALAVGATREEYEELRQQMGGVAPGTAPKQPQVATTPQGSPGRTQLANAGLGGQKFDSGRPPVSKKAKGETIADIKKRFGMR